jgi:Arc/MetJ family transcription regulator
LLWPKASSSVYIILIVEDIKMRITVDIDDSQLQMIRQATGISKKAPAIRQALTEFVAESKRKRFLSKVMEGRVDYGSTNDELEANGTYDAD